MCQVNNAKKIKIFSALNFAFLENGKDAPAKPINANPAQQKTHFTLTKNKTRLLCGQGASSPKSHPSIRTGPCETFHFYGSDARDTQIRPFYLAIN